MRYANVNGVKSEAQPKIRGVCRACDSEVVAKCGKHVIWHWSHLSLNTCDRWWEAETEWHRQWKDRFPEDWQEAVQYDVLTGEKHIADVRTEHGVVVEFQRSTIDPSEVKARESFYQRMVWVIDGAKSEFDCVNFSNMRKANLVTMDLHFFDGTAEANCFTVGTQQSRYSSILETSTVSGECVDWILKAKKESRSW
jgi:hypothetical protein